MSSNAKMLDIQSLINAGINPKTGLPIKLAGLDSPLKNQIKKTLRIIDEQDAVNRYTWYNLPSGLTPQLLERVLYYKGRGAFFYYKGADKFLFLPFSLDGTIDVYGREQAITPLIFRGSSVTSDEKKKIIPFIQGMSKKVAFEVVDEWKPEDMDNLCVILNDYTPQMSEDILPRSILQEPILDTMSEAYPLARTSLISNSGVRGMRVNSQDESGNVVLANAQIQDGALNGKTLIPIVSTIEFQELTGGSAIKAQDFLLYMQSLDSYRLSCYGLETGGIFQKKAHMLEGEMNMNSGHAKLVYQDGLTLRQNFCNIVNSIWGLGIWCDVSESALGIDTNGDMLADDEKDQTGIDDSLPEMSEEGGAE